MDFGKQLLLMATTTFLVACSPESSGNSADAASKASLPSSSASISTFHIASLAKAANVECEAADGGQPACAIGRLNVDLYESCGSDGFFGAVSTDDGVALKEKPTADAASVARLGAGQFLCIQGLARQGQNPEWYFVIAIPVGTVADCKGKELCEIYGDRPVTWTVPPSGKPCTFEEDRYVGDCASGWVAAEAIEAFTEGI